MGLCDTPFLSSVTLAELTSSAVAESVVGIGMSVESVSWTWESSAVRVEKKVVALLALECLPLVSLAPSP